MIVNYTYVGDTPCLKFQDDFATTVIALEPPNTIRSPQFYADVYSAAIAATSEDLVMKLPLATIKFSNDTTTIKSVGCQLRIPRGDNIIRAILVYCQASSGLIYCAFFD